MKFKRSLSLIMALMIIISTAPMSLMATNVKSGLTPGYVNGLLKSLQVYDSTSEGSTLEWRDGLVEKTEAKYHIGPEIEKAWEAFTRMEDFSGYTTVDSINRGINTGNLVLGERTARKQPEITGGGLPSPNSNPLVNPTIPDEPNLTVADPAILAGDTVQAGTRTIYVDALEKLETKYFRELSRAEGIFNKWEGKMYGDTVLDVTDQLLQTNDKYKLQSDIAHIETSALINILADHSSNFGKTDSIGFASGRNSTIEILEKIADETKPFYNKKVIVDYKDTNGEGRFIVQGDSGEPVPPSAMEMTIYQFAMTGMAEGDILNERGEVVKSYIPLPGVFHKGINSLYSPVSNLPSAEKARIFLEEYKIDPYYVGNIYNNIASIDGALISNTETLPTEEGHVMINEDPTEDLLFPVRAMLQYLITIPEELVKFAETPDVVKSWMNENYSTFMANTRLYQDMITLYSATGLTNFSKTLQLFLDDQIKTMNELAILHGLVQNPEGLLPGEDVVDNDAIFNNPHYWELLAWTSAFTPFETDINAYEEAMFHISDASRALYLNNNMGLRRTPVYNIVGQKQNMSDLQAGNNRELVPTTLRSFIRNIETGDVTLFAQAMSEKEIQKIDTISIVESMEGAVDTDASMNSAVEQQTGADNSSSLNNQRIEPFTSYNELTTSTLSEQFIGPIYFSTNDQNYDLVKGYKMMEKLALENNRETALEKLNAIARGYDFKKYSKKITPSMELSQHLTESYGYINYMLMHNTLQNPGVNSPGVQEDLDKPLYVDFLGNILTHSGIVVVPAIANTTYFTSIDKYNFSHAMFMNSYPAISNTRSSRLSLNPGDEDKLMLALYPDAQKEAVSNYMKPYEQEGEDLDNTKNEGVSKGKWRWKVLGIDRDGKFKDNYNIQTPNSMLYKATDKIDGDIRRRGDPDQTLDFFNPVTGVIDIGMSYFSGENYSPKESSRVFSFSEFQELTVKGENFISKVGMNSISTDSMSGDWLAIIGLNLNHLLEEKNGLFVLSTVTMGHLYSILAECSIDNFQMTKLITMASLKEIMLEDKLIVTLAGMFESISNFTLKFINQNLLVYTPTLDNLTLFKDMSLWITPVAIAFVALVVSLGLAYIFLGFFRKEGFEIGKLVFLFLAIPVITFYSLNIHPIVMRGVFENLPSKLLKPDSFLAVADEVEGRYKKVNEFMFVEDELLRDSSINLKIQTLTSKEALEVRKFSDENQGHLDSPLYSPRYDHTLVNVLDDKIYLKGLDYYIDILKLYELSGVEDKPNFDYTFRMEHDMYYGYEFISPRTPYYHFVETVTYAVNTFAEASSVSTRSMNYGHFQKNTGRSKSYFDSIFFVAPDKFGEYLESMNFQHSKNILLYMDEDDVELSAEELEELVDDVDSITPRSQKSLTHILEKMVDIDDWLGIKKIMGKSPVMDPFQPEYVPFIPTNEWFPILSDYEEDELEKKIRSVNTRTKNFVLREMVPVLGHMNDDTAIKTVALYASMEFNKEFSKPMKLNQPVKIEASSISNHYITRSIYMTGEDMFSTSSNSLSYFLANKGPGTLILANIDMVLRNIVYLIPILAIFLLSFLPFILVVVFPLKNTEFFKKLLALTSAVVWMAAMRFPVVIGYKISTSATELTDTTGGIVVSIVISCILLWLLKLLIDNLVVKLIDTFDSSSNSFVDSIDRLVHGLDRDRGVTDPNEFYADRDNNIYSNYNIDEGYHQDYSIAPVSNYNNAFSSGIYNEETNSYVEEPGKMEANFNSFNTDGAGWRNMSEQTDNRDDAGWRNVSEQEDNRDSSTIPQPTENPIGDSYEGSTSNIPYEEGIGDSYSERVIGNYDEETNSLEVTGSITEIDNSVFLDDFHSDNDQKNEYDDELFNSENNKVQDIELYSDSIRDIDI